MPVALNDIANGFKNKMDPFARFALRNPLTTALTISIIVCILLIWIFKDDNIVNRRVKLTKMLVYTFMLSTVVIFLQTAAIIKKSLGRGDIVLSEDVLSGQTSAVAVHAADPDYVRPEIKSMTGQGEFDFMIT